MDDLHDRLTTRRLVLIRIHRGNLEAIINDAVLELTDRERHDLVVIIDKVGQHLKK
jgi:hypothetical protein